MSQSNFLPEVMKSVSVPAAKAPESISRIQTRFA